MSLKSIVREYTVTGMPLGLAYQYTKYGLSLPVEKMQKIFALQGVASEFLRSGLTMGVAMSNEADLKGYTFVAGTYFAITVFEKLQLETAKLIIAKKKYKTRVEDLTPPKIHPSNADKNLENRL